MLRSSSARLQRLHAEQRCLDRLIDALNLETRSPAHRTPSQDLLAGVPRLMEAASDFLHDALEEIQLLLANGSSKRELQEALQSLLRFEVEDRRKRIQLLEDTVYLLRILQTPATTSTWRRCSRRT
jgi:hypothetical protein